MTNIVGTASVIITPNTAGFAAALNSQLTATSSGLAGLSSSLTSAGSALTRQFTVPIGLATAGVVKFGTEFDTAIRSAATIAGVDVTLIGKDIAGMEDEAAQAAATMQSLEQAALDLGTKGRLGPVEVAEGFTELSRAGIEANNIVGAATPILNLATAEQLSFADASEKAINVFAGYGGALQGNANLTEELTHTIDVLAQTSNLSTTSMGELTDAFRFVGPVASGLGIQFEETAAALGILANAGFKGSLGGTALRGTLTRLAIASGESAERLNELGIASEDALEQLTDEELQNVEKQLRDIGLSGRELEEAMTAGAGGTQAAQQAMQRLGVSIFDAEGNMIPLTETLRILEDNGATTADVMAIFGQRAGPGLAALLQRGSGELGALTDRLEESSGAAQKLAEGILSGPEGSFARLKNTLQALAIAISESGVLAGFGSIAEKITLVVDSLRNVDPGILKFVSTLAIALAAIGPVLQILGHFGTSIDLLVGKTGLLTKAFAFIVSGPVGLFVGALVAVGGAFVLAYQNSEKLQEAVGKLGEAVGKILGPVFGAFTDLLGAGGDQLAELAGSLGDFIAGPIESLAEWITNLADQLGNLWDVFSEGDDVAQGAAEIIDNIFGNTGALVGPVRTVVTLFQQWWSTLDSFRETLSFIVDEGLANLQAALTGVWEALHALFSGDFDSFAEKGGEALRRLGQAFVNFAFQIPLVVMTAFTNLGTMIADALQNVPILGPLTQALAGVGQAFRNAFGSVGAILDVALSDAFDPAEKLELIAQFAQQILTELGNALSAVEPLVQAGIDAGVKLAEGVAQGLFVELPKLLAGAAGFISGPLADALSSALEAAAAQLQGTPLEGVSNAISTGLPDAVRTAGDAVGGLGETLSKLPEFFQSLGDSAEQNLLPALREIGSAVGPILGTLGDVLTQNLIPALQELWPIAQNVAEIVGKVLAVAIVLVTNAVAGLLDSGGLEFITSALSALGDAFQSAVHAVRGFTDIIAGLLSGDMEQVKAGILALAEGILGLIESVFASAPKAITDFIGSLGDTIFGALQDIPVLGELFETLKQVLGDVSQILGGIFDIIGGIVSFDIDRIATGIYNLADGILQIMGEALTALPEILGDIISDGIGLITGGLAGIGEWIADNLSEIPVLGEAFETIGQIVNDVADGVGDIATIIGGLLRLDFGAVGEGFKNLGASILGILREALTGIPEILIDVISDAIPFIGDALSGIGDWIQEAFSDVPIVGELFDELGNIINNVGELLSGIFDVLAGIFTLDFGRLLDGLKQIGAAIFNALGGLLGNAGELLVDLGALLLEALGAIFTSLWDWITTDGVALLGDALGAIPGALGALLGSLGDIGGALIEWAGIAWDALVDWFETTALPALGSFLASLPGAIGGFLGDLGSTLVDWFSAAWDWLVQNGPTILAALGGFLAGLPGMILGWLGDLGGLIVGWFQAAWDWLVTNGPTILLGLANWLAGLGTSILGWLGDLGATLVGWMTAAWDWIVTNAPGILAGLIGWLAGLPGQILGWIGDLGGALVGFITGAWDFIVSNGPAILAQVTLWFQGMIGNILGWIGDLGAAFVGLVQGAWDWVVQNGPTILTGILGWFTGLPGQILSAIGNLGTFLWDNVFVPARDWLVQNIPGMLDRLVDFFKEIPGRIFDALTTVGSLGLDFAKNLGNAVIDFLNAQVIDRINDLLEITVDPPGPGSVTVDPPDIPHIPRLATGGIFTRATTAIIGEDGDEVVIPLTDKARALMLAEVSGLTDMILSTLQGTQVPAGQLATVDTLAGARAPTETASAAVLSPGALTAAPTALIPVPQAATFGTQEVPSVGGDTFNIYGVSADQVVAKIRAEKEAELRRIRR